MNAATSDAILVGQMLRIDDDHLLDEISRVLAAPAGQEARSLSQIEHTLTTGYAHAHALEAERRRLDAKISDVAALLAAEGAAHHSAALRDLTEKKSGTEHDLARLRGLLKPLRERAAALRRA